MNRSSEQIEHHKRIFREYLGDTMDRINGMLVQHDPDSKLSYLMQLVETDSRFFFTFRPRTLVLSINDPQVASPKEWRSAMDAFVDMFNGLEGCEAGPLFGELFIVPSCAVTFPSWSQIESIVERRRLEAAAADLDRDPGSMGLFL